MLFDISYFGEDEFRVFLIDSTGGAFERLLTPNRLRGPYEGVRALAYQDRIFEDHHVGIHAFKVRVEGDGAWAVRVGLPDFRSPPITSARGNGDHVIGPFRLQSPDPFVADFVFDLTHEGEEFEARLISSDGSTSVLVPRQDAAFENRPATVNVFAPWNEDRGPDGLSYDDYLLEIYADGEWTVRMREPESEPPPAPREDIAFGRLLGTYAGTGNERFTYTFADAGLAGAPLLFSADFKGGSEFSVVLVDLLEEHGRQLTPSGVIGPYQGVRALAYKDGVLDGKPITTFIIRVEGLGAWEVKFGLPDFDSSPITSVQGRGDHVVGPFLLTSEDLLNDDFVFEVTHRGANFEAQIIASDGTAGSLISPQHIPFEDKKVWLNLYEPEGADGGPGDLPYGAYVIAIQADGEWAVRLLEAESEEGT